MNKAGFDHKLTPVLVGVNWARTRRALLLAVGFFTVVGTLRHIVIRNLQGSAYYLLSALLEAFTFESQIAPFAMGWITILGLTAVHAYLNEGYIPGLVLATGPIYGYYVFQRTWCCPGLGRPLYRPGGGGSRNTGVLLGTPPPPAPGARNRAHLPHGREFLKAVPPRKS